MCPFSWWSVEDLMVSLYYLWIKVLECPWYLSLLITHGFDLFPSETHVGQGLFCVLSVKLK